MGVDTLAGIGGYASTAQPASGGYRVPGSSYGGCPQQQSAYGGGPPQQSAYGAPQVMLLTLYTNRFVQCRQ